MGKAVNITTREGREKLKTRTDPYWREVTRGKAIGYRKGTYKRDWYVREYAGGAYRKRVLGKADDDLPANGKDVLTFEQALQMVMGGPAENLPTRRSGYTVRDLAAEYFEYRKAHSRSALSVTLDRQKMDAAVLPKYGDTPVVDLTTAALQGFLTGFVTEAMENAPEDETDRREAQRKAQATANRNWAPFHAMLEWGRREHPRKIPATPWRDVRRFRRVDRPRERFLSVEECRRLLNAARPDFRELARGALLTGLRYGELCRLRVADFTGDAVTVQASKSDKVRSVPLTTEGVELFEELTAGRAGGEYIFRKADGSPWTVQDQKRPMRAACKAAKIDPAATFHDLRRTYGSLLVNKGAPMAVIAKALGHADTRMTERVYARLMDETLRAELQKRLPRIEPRRKRKVVRLRSR